MSTTVQLAHALIDLHRRIDPRDERFTLANAGADPVIDLATMGVGLAEAVLVEAVLREAGQHSVHHELRNAE